MTKNTIFKLSPRIDVDRQHQAGDLMGRVHQMRFKKAFALTVMCVFRLLTTEAGDL